MLPKRPGGLISWRSASRRIAIPRFVPIPVDRRELSGHDETFLTVPSPD